MRATSTLLFLLFSLTALSQIPKGYGTFPKVRKANIKSITEYHVTLNDTTRIDTTFREKVTFNDRGQLIQRKLPSFRQNWPRYINYEYNSRGYLKHADSSGGLWGYGYSSIGDDTLYSHVEETWEHLDTTKRIFRRRTSIDNWNTYSDTQFFYDEYGRLVEEKSVHVDKSISQVNQSRREIIYEVYTFIRERNNYSEDQLVSKELYVFEYF